MRQKPNPTSSNTGKWIGSCEQWNPGTWLGLMGLSSVPFILDVTFQPDALS